MRSPPAPITHLVASNNILCLSLANGCLLRIPLQQPEKQDELEIPLSAGDKVAYIHQDPNGEHVIVSTHSGDNFYVQNTFTNNKLKPLPKLKGNVLSAVGWNQELSKENSTSFILVGTTRGLIFETELKDANVNYLKQVFCVSDNPALPKPVTGIHLSRCKIPQSNRRLSSSETVQEDRTEVRHLLEHVAKTAEGFAALQGRPVLRVSDLPINRWFVLVSTPGQLYPFGGTISINSSSSFSLVGEMNAVLYPLFIAHEKTGGRVHTLDPSATISSPSSLQLYPAVGDDPPSHFAWMAAPGVKYGRIDSTTMEPFKMTLDDGLLCHPELNGRPDYPIAMCLSEFHIVLLFQNRVAAMSNLNEATTYEDLLGTKFGRMLGMTRDPVSGLIWVYTDRGVLRYKATDEARYVWSVYLERGDFSAARRFATGQPKHLNTVLKQEGQSLLDKGKFTAAAEIFAMTNAPFEETALKFVQAENRDGLRKFLEKRFDQLEPMEKTQQTMLVLWLLEIHLTELGEARSGTGLGKSTTVRVPPVARQMSVEGSYEQMWDQFRFFVGKQNVLECLKANPEPVMQMMTSHGDIDAMLYFADIQRDYDTYLSLCVQQERYDDALAVLQKQSDAALFYKFSPSLIVACTHKLIEVWISQKANLKAKLLLPALFHCDKDQTRADEAIRYLEFCLSNHGASDPAIHNYLISLYAKFHPEKLLTYLEAQGTDSQNVCYDMKYALRLCTERKLHRACVHIYATLGLYEEAVNLALKIDIELAKKCAQLPGEGELDLPFNVVISSGGFGGVISGGGESEELRKKLWLCIARYVVEKEQNIEKCMQLLHESEGLIKIQDLLPFFPEFATIEHFKDSLCACLKEHSGKIQELQREMKEATEVAQDMRKDMSKLKNRYNLIRVQDKCAGCSDSLTLRPFYAFPCKHNFHNDCLIEEVRDLLTIDQLEKYTNLKKQLIQVMSANTNVGPGTAGFAQAGRGLLFRATEQGIDSLSQGSLTAAQKQEQAIRAQIDEIMAGECPWCGDLMVSSIDRPFYEPAEYVRSLRSWDAGGQR